jgi:hypothetical protein
MILSLWYLWHKPCTYLALTLTLSPNKPKQDSHDPRHLGVPSGASKMISMPMVRSAQTVHLSCSKFSTISKRTESSLHLSLVTYEYHRVHPKQLLSLWYIWRKPCTYLASTLALSPNGPKRDSKWSTSPRSSIRCVQNDFLACGTFGANCAPIFRQD